MKRIQALLITITLFCTLLLSGCEGILPSSSSASYSLDDLPAYSGEPYVTINDNEPFFTQEDMTTNSYETYSDLDALGRCGVAWANVGIDLMPTEDRGSIGQVKPSGWQTVKYDCVDGITGTRYMNVDGMLPFENQVADYVKETENHVLYRVTPIFQEDELVARGVLMEGLSVEDGGEGICFCVYAYNVQPGIVIDYATGDSWLEEDDQPQETTNASVGTAYVINTNSGKFHLPTCSSVEDISPSNRQDYVGDRQELLDQGYTPCGICKP